MTTARANESTSKDLIRAIESEQLRSDIPDFRPGDTVRVHAKIIEGNKERIQVFEGIVLKRHKGSHATASFTVRKLSYNIGVEKTFMLHSPRIAKIELVTHGKVRRARLFYLRPLRGKAARIRSKEGQVAGTEELSRATSQGESANAGADAASE